MSAAPVFQSASIPAELRALPQWVCWRYETRNGKPTKPPIDAKSNGQLIKAKVNDPSTWTDFDTAVAAATRMKMEGIGLMVSADDGLTGLDLDHVIDPATGELDPLAIEVLERFANTYAEISPSGTGIRIWCYGKAARSGKCLGAVKWLEVYTHPSSRYLTLTGNHWPGSATAVTVQQDALDWLHGRFMVKDASVGGERTATLLSPVVTSLGDGWGEPPPDDDCLAMKCPQCGAKAEFPDCESCGFTFAQPNPVTTGGESQAAPLSVGASLDLDDQALLNKISQSKNGSAFDALWAGDLSNCNSDHSSADLALCNALAFWTGKDAPRMDRLFRQSRLIRPKWDEKHHEDGRTYGQGTIEKAIADCRNTFSGKRKPSAKATKPRAKADQRGDEANELNPWRGTDDANADLLLGLHGADIRFCPPWDKWILWSGSHWRIDNRLDIDRLAADVPKMIRNEAVRLTQQRSGVLLRMAELQSQFPLPPEYDKLFLEQKALGDKSEYLLKLADSLERIGKRGAMLTAARHKVVIHHSDLDKGQFLLNASNGTVDLQTGVLRPHERVDLLTHDVEIPYLQNANAPAWLAFLHSTFGGDADLIQFVQRAIGYSLTGDVREQVLLICHGVGSNGKSVFLNILRKLLGTLAIQAAPDLLMGDLKHRHPTEQADLFGKRAIICQETGDGQRFNEKLVKQLTGGDGIRARRMHEDFWEFNPTHKLWLSTNHKPEIKGTDHAIWRRIRLIPFNVKFTDDGEPRKNPDMERQLTAELPGILAWAVAGCLDWQRNGLGKAAAVEAATAGYQAEMDVFAAWIGECCIVGKRFEAKAADLYRSYVQWCERSGEYPEKQRKFGMRLTDREFIGFTSNGAWWRGIGIVSDRYGSAEGTEGTEPKNAIFEKNKNDPFYVAEKAFSGSVGSVPSVNPLLGTPSPPVDATDTGEKWESFH